MIRSLGAVVHRADHRGPGQGIQLVLREITLRPRSIRGFTTRVSLKFPEAWSSQRDGLIKPGSYMEARTGDPAKGFNWF